MNDDPGQTRTLTLAFQYKTQTLSEGAKIAAIAVSHMTPQRLEPLRVSNNSPDASFELERRRKKCSWATFQSADRERQGGVSGRGATIRL